jgi:hypothetical protein
MRGTGVLVSLAVGCGHLGFDVCAGCTPEGKIERLQTVAPGAGIIPFDIPIAAHAGNLLLAAVYANGPSASVGDDTGSLWQTTPEEVSPCATNSSTYGALRFYYRFADANGPHTLTLYAGNGNTAVGAVVIEYAGVAAAPIDTSSGDIGIAATATLDAGMIEATGPGQLVAAFEDVNQALVMTPAADLHQLAHDDAFSLLVADAPADVGTYTPTATTTPGATASKCWLGTSVVLRAR